MKQFQNHAQKATLSLHVKYQDKRGMLPFFSALSASIASEASGQENKKSIFVKNGWINC